MGTWSNWYGEGYQAIKEALKTEEDPEVRIELEKAVDNRKEIHQS